MSKGLTELPQGIESLFELEQWLRSVFTNSYEREISARSIEDNIKLAIKMEQEVDTQIDAQIDEYYLNRGEIDGNI